jgi:hypothetical protein
MEPESRPGENQEPRQCWLDQALVDYGKVEPRFGLENRVLANIATERALRRDPWLPRWWAAGLALTVAVVLAVVWLESRQSSTPHPRKADLSVAQKKSGPLPQPTLPNPPEKAQGTSRVAPHVPRQHESAKASSPAPRLQQFPTPVPLSPQEQVLARYVSEFPHHSLLVARAQTALLEEENREESKPEQGQKDSIDSEKRDR